MTPKSDSARWEVIASAAATIAATVATVAAEDIAGLQYASKNLKMLASWYKAAVTLPASVWWLATFAIAGALFYLGMRLRPRWGTLALFLAPAAMLVLQYVLPWLLYAPIKTLTPAAG